MIGRVTFGTLFLLLHAGIRQSAWPDPIMQQHALTHSLPQISISIILICGGYRLGFHNSKCQDTDRRVLLFASSSLPRRRVFINSSRSISACTSLLIFTIIIEHVKLYFKLSIKFAAACPRAFLCFNPFDAGMF
jgi:hypothetical protein